MARLYPPNISGVLPSFYGSELTIPFVMNKVVSVASVAGFVLRVKSAATETLLFQLNTTQEGTEAYFDESSVTFNISTHGSKLHIGDYYKVQLAYISSSTGEIGYFSSVGIIKYTGKPEVWIHDFNELTANISPGTIIGEYSNPLDYTEKDYEYRFVLSINKDTIVDDTGWLAHYSGTDVDKVDENNANRISLEQIDTYQLKYTLDDANMYYIQYMVRTNNDLYVYSPHYEIIENATMESTLQANLYAELDYDNACIVLKLVPYNSATTVIVGSFEIGRAEAIDDFKIWTVINSFSLNGRLPPEGRIFTDFTIEQGSKYQYAIRQKNANGVYSSWILTSKWRRKKPGYLTYDEEDKDWNYTKEIEASFEDAFLFDGDRQLKIRFNPKVNSFKSVVQDSKKVAIGNKYPYFFRNGIIEYKEFSISGLISYLSDENEYFASRTKELGMPTEWEDTTDITDYNLIYERRFKMAVLEWLNKDNVKLFKSPGEGNYLVKITNVSFAPQDSLSRMLHTFTCTATEVGKFNIDTLIDYNFLTTESTEGSQVLFLTTLITQTDEGEPNISESYDLFEGLAGIYLKLENFLPGSKFRLSNLEIMIGETGQYETRLETPMRLLRIEQDTLEQNIEHGLNPSVTVGVLSKGFTTFDLVYGVTGRQLMYIRAENTTNLQQEFYNILEPYIDLKHQIQKLYYLKLSPRPLVDADISYDAIRAYFNNQTETKIPDIDMDSVYKIRITQKMLDEVITPSLNNPGATTFYHRTDLKIGDFVYMKPMYVPNNGPHKWVPGWSTTYSTQVQLGETSKYVVNELGIQEERWSPVIIDVAHTTMLTYKDLDYIPVNSNYEPYIGIGNGVVAEFGAYQKIITYDMEADVEGAQLKLSSQNKLEFLKRKQAYYSALLNYEGDSTTPSAYSRYFTGKITLAQYNTYKNTYTTTKQRYMEILQSELDYRKKAVETS